VVTLLASPRFACYLIDDEQHKPGGTAVIPSNPCRKVIIPLLYSLATLPIAAL